MGFYTNRDLSCELLTIFAIDMPNIISEAVDKRRKRSTTIKWMYQTEGKIQLNTKALMQNL